MLISKLIRVGTVGLLAVSVFGVMAEDARADHYARRSQGCGGSYSAYGSSYDPGVVVRYREPVRVYREHRPVYYSPSHSARVVYDAQPVRYVSPRRHLRIERPRRYLRPLRREHRSGHYYQPRLPRHRSHHYFQPDRRHRPRRSVGLRIGRTHRHGGRGGLGIRVRW